MSGGLILASQSPRRVELLARLGLDFEQLAVDIHESAIASGLDPDAAVVELALAKAQTAQQLRPTATVVAADTVVVANGRIYGKPRDDAEARANLVELAGADVAVLSGVAVAAGDDVDVEAVATRLVMTRPSAQEISAYVATGAPADKAGGLEVQGRARKFVAEVTGCWSNVVGLPLCATARLLGVDYPSGVCEEPKL